jgi:hypothetical protein
MPRGRVPHGTDDLCEIFPPLPRPRKFKTTPESKRGVRTLMPQALPPRPFSIPVAKVAQLRRFRIRQPPKPRR